jgi:hypothetical protein
MSSIFFYPYIEKRIRKSNIKEGMTVVDYGCGPGRYSLPQSGISPKKHATT